MSRIGTHISETNDKPAAKASGLARLSSHSGERVSNPFRSHLYIIAIILSAKKRVTTKHNNIKLCHSLPCCVNIFLLLRWTFYEHTQRDHNRFAKHYKCNAIALIESEIVCFTSLPNNRSLNILMNVVLWWWGEWHAKSGGTHNIRKCV